MDTPTTKAELIHQVLVAAEELWIHAKAPTSYVQLIKGDTGATEAKRDAGTPATSPQRVFAVTLCPSHPISYPSSFPESALCVDDRT